MSCDQSKGDWHWEKYFVTEVGKFWCSVCHLVDTSLSLETKKWSRCRWWCHFKEVWKRVHLRGIWPSEFFSPDNHTSLISVIDLILLTLLSLFTHRNRNSVFASTNSSWPEQTCRGWVLSRFHFNFTMFWPYRWKELFLSRELWFIFLSFCIAI